MADCDLDGYPPQRVLSEAETLLMNVQTEFPWFMVDPGDDDTVLWVENVLEVFHRKSFRLKEMVNVEDVRLLPRKVEAWYAFVRRFLDIEGSKALRAFSSATYMWNRETLENNDDEFRFHDLYVPTRESDEFVIVRVLFLVLLRIEVIEKEMLSIDGDSVTLKDPQNSCIESMSGADRDSDASEGSDESNDVLLQYDQQMCEPDHDEKEYETENVDTNEILRHPLLGVVSRFISGKNVFIIDKVASDSVRAIQETNDGSRKPMINAVTAESIRFAIDSFLRFLLVADGGMLFFRLYQRIVLPEYVPSGLAGQVSRWQRNRVADSPLLSYLIGEYFVNKATASISQGACEAALSATSVNWFHESCLMRSGACAVPYRQQCLLAKVANETAAEESTREYNKTMKSLEKYKTHDRKQDTGKVSSFADDSDRRLKRSRPEIFSDDDDDDDDQAHSSKKVNADTTGKPASERTPLGMAPNLIREQEPVVVNSIAVSSAQCVSPEEAFEWIGPEILDVEMRNNDMGYRSSRKDLDEWGSLFHPFIDNAANFADLKPTSHPHQWSFAGLVDKCRAVFEDPSRVDDRCCDESLTRIECKSFVDHLLRFGKKTVFASSPTKLLDDHLASPENDAQPLFPSVCYKDPSASLSLFSRVVPNHVAFLDLCVAARRPQELKELLDHLKGDLCPGCPSEQNSLSESDFMRSALYFGFCAHAEVRVWKTLVEGDLFADRRDHERDICMLKEVYCDALWNHFACVSVIHLCPGCILDDLKDHAKQKPTDIYPCCCFSDTIDSRNLRHRTYSERSERILRAMVGASESTMDSGLLLQIFVLTSADRFRTRAVERFQRTCKRFARDLHDCALVVCKNVLSVGSNALDDLFLSHGSQSSSAEKSRSTLISEEAVIANVDILYLLFDALISLGNPSLMVAFCESFFGLTIRSPHWSASLGKTLDSSSAGDKLKAVTILGASTSAPEVSGAAVFDASNCGIASGAMSPEAARVFVNHYLTLWRSARMVWLSARAADAEKAKNYFKPPWWESLGQPSSRPYFDHFFSLKLQEPPKRNTFDSGDQKFGRLPMSRGQWLSRGVFLRVFEDLYEIKIGFDLVPKADPQIGMSSHEKMIARMLSGPPPIRTAADVEIVPLRNSSEANATSVISVGHRGMSQQTLENLSEYFFVHEKVSFVGMALRQARPEPAVPQYWCVRGGLQAHGSSANASSVSECQSSSEKLALVLPFVTPFLGRKASKQDIWSRPLFSEYEYDNDCGRDHFFSNDDSGKRGTKLALERWDVITLSRVSKIVRDICYPIDYDHYHSCGEIRRRFLVSQLRLCGNRSLGGLKNALGKFDPNSVVDLAIYFDPKTSGLYKRTLDDVNSNYSGKAACNVVHSNGGGIVMSGANVNSKAKSELSLIDSKDEVSTDIDVILRWFADCTKCETLNLTLGPQGLPEDFAFLASVERLMRGGIENRWHLKKLEIVHEPSCGCLRMSNFNGNELTNDAGVEVWRRDNMEADRIADCGMRFFALPALETLVFHFMLSEERFFCDVRRLLENLRKGSSKNLRFVTLRCDFEAGSWWPKTRESKMLAISEDDDDPSSEDSAHLRDWFAVCRLLSGFGGLSMETLTIDFEHAGGYNSDASLLAQPRAAVDFKKRLRAGIEKERVKAFANAECSMDGSRSEPNKQPYIDVTIKRKKPHLFFNEFPFWRGGGDLNFERDFLGSDEEENARIRSTWEVVSDSDGEDL